MKTTNKKIYEIFHHILDNNYLEDRLEYDVSDFLSAYPELTRGEALLLQAWLVLKSEDEKFTVELKSCDCTFGCRKCMPLNWAIDRRVGVDRDPGYSVSGGTPDGTGGGVLAWHLTHEAAAVDMFYLMRAGFTNLKLNKEKHNG